jgi:hypothetical protein
MATRLGDMAVGSTVKIKVNGTVKDFIIVHQGKPSSIYDDSCDGTWVLLKDVYTTSTFGSRNNSYKDSSIHSYLNSTFYDLIDSDIRAVIKQVKIPYWYGTGRDGSLATGSNGLSTKVFLLSCYEIGARNGYGIPNDGAELDYFKSGDRVAYGSGGATTWWQRSPQTGNTYNVWFVNSAGSSNVNNYGNSNGVRPAFVLPSLLVVFNDGTVTGNFAPEVTSDSGATGTELGEKNAPFMVGYTVTDKDGDPMTVTEKLDGTEQVVKTEVATGTALTVEWLSEKVGYQQVLNGSHTITLTVSDGKISVDWTATFTKNVTGAQVSLTAPLTADDTITVAALTLAGSFPADMSLTVELTNNARDDAPVWETVTDIQRGESRAFVHHAFTNKTAVRGFAFNYKVTVARGESGVGGNITMIGGVIG